MSPFSAAFTSELQDSNSSSMDARPDFVNQPSIAVPSTEEITAFNKKNQNAARTPSVHLAHLNDLEPTPEILAQINRIAKYHTYTSNRVLFKLNLYSLNSILDFASLSRAESTLDFDVKKFTGDLLRISRKKKLTQHQLQVVKYLNCCKKRLTNDFEIEDFKYAVKPDYPCDKCDRVFVHKGNLHQHIRIEHDNEKLNCEFSGCNYTCKLRTSLIHHFKAKHSDEPNRYGCSLCKDTFAVKSSLTRHTKQKHSGEELKRYECSLCEETFSRKDGLYRHTKQKHSGEVYNTQRPYG